MLGGIIVSDCLTFMNANIFIGSILHTQSTHTKLWYLLFHTPDYIQVGHSWLHHQDVSSFLHITLLGEDARGAYTVYIR